MIESIAPSKYRLLFALAIPVEKGNLGPRHRGAGEAIGCAHLVGGPCDWWPEVTLRGRSAQQEAPLVQATTMCGHDSLHWLSKLSTTLWLTFDQRFPFNTRKICLEREGEKAHYGEINGSRVSDGLGFIAQGASARARPVVLPSGHVLGHFMEHGLYQHEL